MSSEIEKTANKNNDRKVLEALSKLIEVVAQLRNPNGGCPWDLAQTPETLIPYIIEEAYETTTAIRSGNKESIKEELGDLLLQVILQAQIAKEENQFNLQDIANGITEKLIRRHPHVFGTTEVEGIDEVRKNWEEIKAQEKGLTPQTAQLVSYKLNRYAQTLPPLMAASKISYKAASTGLEWENVDGVWDKFHEELAEFKEALQSEDRAAASAELGDVLFTLINLARWYDLNPSEALHGTNQRFIQRLSKIETFADRPLAEYTLDELENLWKRAKAELNH